MHACHLRVGGQTEWPCLPSLGILCAACGSGVRRPRAGVRRRSLVGVLLAGFVSNGVWDWIGQTDR